MTTQQTATPKKFDPETIEAVRSIVRQITRQCWVPDDIRDEAQSVIMTMCKDASEHGLTTADVIRALCQQILNPDYHIKQKSLPLQHVRRHSGDWFVD